MLRLKPSKTILGFIFVVEAFSLSIGGSDLFGRQELLDVWQPWFPVLSEVNPTFRLVQGLPRDHLDALNDRADGVAEGAAGARVLVHLHIS